MSTRVIVLTGLLGVMTTGLIVAIQILFMVIGEINRKRPEGDLVSYFVFTLPKMRRIFTEYRAKYPNGRLHIYIWRAFAAVMIGMVGVAATFHFFDFLIR